MVFRSSYGVSPVNRDRRAAWILEILIVFALRSQPRLHTTRNYEVTARYSCTRMVNICESSWRYWRKLNRSGKFREFYAYLCTAMCLHVGMCMHTRISISRLLVRRPMHSRESYIAAGRTGLNLAYGDQISAEQTRRPELIVASDADEVYRVAR